MDSDLLLSICTGRVRGLPLWLEAEHLLKSGRRMPSLKVPFLFAGSIILLIIQQDRRLCLPLLQVASSSLTLRLCIASTGSSSKATTTVVSQPPSKAS